MVDVNQKPYMTSIKKLPQLTLTKKILTNICQQIASISIDQNKLVDIDRKIVSNDVDLQTSLVDVVQENPSYHRQKMALTKFDRKNPS